MADKILIQGAASVAKSKQGPDIASAIEKGLESGFAPLKEYIKKEEAYNINKAKKLGAFGDNYNPNALDGENRIFMDKSLRESRMEYSKLLDQTRNLNSSSEEYIDMLAKASQIEAGFNQTLTDTLEFSELGAEYIKEAKLGNISAGMTKDDIALFDKIWIDKEYELVRDSLSGKLSYKVGDQIIPKEKLDDWKIPNQEFAKKFVINYNDNAYKAGAIAGQKLTPEDYKYKQIQFSITQDLKSMPIEEIRSLYKDKMLGNNPLLVEPENLFQLSKEQLIPIAIEGLMNNIVNTNLEGLESYKPSKSEINNVTYAQQIKNTENAAIKARIDEAYKAAINDYNQGNLKAGAFERVKTLFGLQVDIAPIDIKRGIFAVKYKSAPTDPDFISATIDLSDKKSQATLYDLAGLRPGVDFNELPNLQIIKPTGPTAPTQEETRTIKNPLLQ